MNTDTPERIYLPADTGADVWAILEKNPSCDWSTGKPANNIEFIRADRVEALREVLETAARELEWLYTFAINHGLPEAGYPPHVAARAALAKE